MSNHDRHFVLLEKKLREARPWVTVLPPVVLIAVAFIIVSVYTRAPSELASARIEPAKGAHKTQLHSTRPSQKP
jgi:hypothetical protein